MTTIGKRDRRTQGGQSLGRGWRNSKRTITKKKMITTKKDKQDHKATKFKEEEDDYHKEVDELLQEEC